MARSFIFGRSGRGAATRAPTERALLAAIARAALFNPLKLFADGEEGVWFDPSDFTTMFTDTGGTTNVTTFGDLVARIDDKSGNGNNATQAISGKRPTLARHPVTGARNLLLSTDTLATQNVTTAASLHTLSFRGTGTITLTGTSTSGPLVGTGANDVVSLSFTPTAGTLTLTVSGTVEIAQLELGSSRTAYQKVTTKFDITETGEDDRFYLSFDGSDDALATADIDFTGTDKMSFFAGLRKLSNTTGIVLEISPIIDSNTGAFQFASLANGRWQIVSKGTISAVALGDAVLSPLTNVVTGLMDISGDSVINRRDGVQEKETTTDQGTGDYGNHALFIGSRGGTSLPFNGSIYSIIIRGAANTDSELNGAEAFTARATGVNI